MEKYLKYKSKYLDLKEIIGGANNTLWADITPDPDPHSQLVPQQRQQLQSPPLQQQPPFIPPTRTGPSSGQPKVATVLNLSQPEEIHLDAILEGVEKGKRKGQDKGHEKEQEKGKGYGKGYGKGNGKGYGKGNGKGQERGPRQEHRQGQRNGEGRNERNRQGQQHDPRQGLGPGPGPRPGQEQRQWPGQGHEKGKGQRNGEGHKERKPNKPPEINHDILTKVQIKVSLPLQCSITQKYKAGIIFYFYYNNNIYMICIKRMFGPIQKSDIANGDRRDSKYTYIGGMKINEFPKETAAYHFYSLQDKHKDNNILRELEGQLSNTNFSVLNNINLDTRTDAEYIYLIPLDLDTTQTFTRIISSASLKIKKTGLIPFTDGTLEFCLMTYTFAKIQLKQQVYIGLLNTLNFNKTTFKCLMLINEYKQQNMREELNQNINDCTNITEHTDCSNTPDSSNTGLSGNSFTCIPPIQDSNGVEYIVVPRGWTFYKAAPYNTVKEDVTSVNLFDKKSKEYTWYTDGVTAMSYYIRYTQEHPELSQYNPDVLPKYKHKLFAYKLIKNINLIILNRNNIKKLIDKIIQKLMEKTQTCSSNIKYNKDRNNTINKYLLQIFYIRLCTGYTMSWNDQLAFIKQNPNLFNLIKKKKLNMLPPFMPKSCKHKSENYGILYYDLNYIISILKFNKWLMSAICEHFNADGYYTLKMPSIWHANKYMLPEVGLCTSLSSLEYDANNNYTRLGTREYQTLYNKGETLAKEYIAYPVIYIDYDIIKQVKPKIEDLYLTYHIIIFTTTNSPNVLKSLNKEINKYIYATENNLSVDNIKALIEKKRQMSIVQVVSDKTDYHNLNQLLQTNPLPIHPHEYITGYASNTELYHASPNHASSNRASADMDIPINSFDEYFGGGASAEYVNRIEMGDAEELYYEEEVDEEQLYEDY